MDTATRERIEIGGERRYERLAFTRAHLCNLALMQRDAADELNVEVTHLERSTRSLPNHCEGLRQECVEILLRGVTLLELERRFTQRFVAERGQFRFQRVGGSHELAVALQQPLVPAAENSGHDVRDGAEQGE